MMRSLVAAVTAGAAAAAMAVGVQAAAVAGPLTVCHAGSLTAAFTTIEAAFTAAHPEVMLTDVAGGSVDLARRFATGAIACDVFAPADHLVIDTLLRPAGLADSSIVFAHGRMVLAYVATDPRAQALAVEGSFAPPQSLPRVQDNWYTVLTAPGVRIAGAHPFLDPGGYRAHMIFELAESHHKVPGLYNALLRHYVVNPADGATPAPVLGRDFDFQFTYEHSAAAAAMRDPSYRYALLPPEIDLSGTNDRLYPQSRIIMPGLGTPRSARSVSIPASTVEWGVTIVANTRHRDAAAAFVTMLLGQTGHDALAASGPAPITPARVTRRDAGRLSKAIRALVRVG
jgi:molybdate/tungstate transport system substrate-binding protein